MILLLLACHRPPAPPAPLPDVAGLCAALVPGATRDQLRDAVTALSFEVVGVTAEYGPYVEVVWPGPSDRATLEAAWGPGREQSQTHWDDPLEWAYAVVPGCTLFAVEVEGRVVRMGARHEAP